MITPLLSLVLFTQKGNLCDESKRLVSNIIEFNSKIDPSQKPFESSKSLESAEVSDYGTETKYSTSDFRIYVDKSGWVSTYGNQRMSSPRLVTDGPAKIAPGIAESKAREVVAKLFPEWKYKISPRETGSTSNNVMSRSSYGFNIFPETNGVSWGPGPSLGLAIDQDKGTVSSAHFFRMPTRIQAKPAKMLTVEQIKQKAMGYALSFGKMEQAEIVQEPALYITFKELGKLNEKNPIVENLKGENVGVYGYYVFVKYSIGRTGGMAYFLSAEDGSILRGQSTPVKIGG